MKVGQKILSVSADGFEELRRLGLLRYNAGRDIKIYNYYLSEVDITGSRMQARPGSGTSPPSRSASMNPLG